MAIYHAHIKSFSRGKGESSLAAAAYRAGLDLVDTKTRDWHRYANRKGVAAVRMLAPAGAPDWCTDAQVFWDANEQWENRANARVARELEVSLPFELDEQQREALAVALGQMLVDRYGTVVMVAIHEPSGSGDQRNFHVHLLMSARQVGSQGPGDRAGAEFDARGGRGAQEIRVVRELVSTLINQHLSQAGIEQTVDHRSLKDQAKAAAAAGDYKSAVRLTRPPTKHLGKVATALARKEEAAESTEAQMDQAMAAAAARGALISTPITHSHSAAMAERIAARRANPPAPAPRRGMAARPARAGQASYTARRLSHLARIGRSQGRDAEVLNVEAELIEQWLAEQAKAAEAALAWVQEIPGVRLEPAFGEALATLRTHRVGIYGAKPFFFEDTEALAWAIQNYAYELRRPHDNRQRLWKAQVRMSEAKNAKLSGSDVELLRARRDLWKAKRGVGSGAAIESERRTNQARDLMIEARNGIERDFPITRRGPLETDPFGPFPPEEEGGATKSESNQRELKPRPSPRF